MNYKLCLKEIKIYLCIAYKSEDGAEQCYVKETLGIN